ncbi:MAG: hypothetical protein ACM3ML_14910, partial [Micromonosporaceae bacterium]
MSIPVAVLEDIIDNSGVAAVIEGLLPSAARHRELRIQTLLLGMQLALADDRPAHLTRVHQALTALPEADRVRPGILEERKTGPHQLTYRQAEHTFSVAVPALSKDEPDGAPSPELATVCDDLLETTIASQHKDASAPLAADWADVESWSRPPRHGATECADPEAAWGHRNTNLPGPKGEMFFGYYLPAAVTVADKNGPPVPELARRITVAGCDHDPVRQHAALLLRMAGDGTPPGDIIDDSGYAHRDAQARAVPLRNPGAQLAQDLHPSDRGPKGTHDGAVIVNVNLHRPQTPRTPLELSPLPPGTAPDTLASHDQQAARRRAGCRRRPQPAGRRTRPAQARPAHRRRRRRLPPRHLPRNRRQDPLPAPAGLDDPGPGPARDPHPARRTARLLHPADHHRRTRGGGQDPPEARLPVRRLAAVLPAAH